MAAFARALIACFAFVASTGAAKAACAPHWLLPPHRGVTGTTVSVDDIARLRDIGSQDEPSMAVSPSGRNVVFLLRRADPVRNVVCSAIVLLSTRGGSPRVLDDGGEPALERVDFRGRADVTFGEIATTPIRWSDDGKWFAYLKRRRGLTQLWVAGPRVKPHLVTHTGWDVRTFRLIDGGAHIAITGRPDIGVINRRLRQEGNAGYHYDARFSPMAAKHPYPAAPVRVETFIVQPNTATMRAASAADHDQRAAQSQATRGAPIITLQPTDPLSGQSRLMIATDASPPTACADAACVGRLQFAGVIGSGTAQTQVVFVRDEGWAARTAALYVWSPNSNSVRRISSERAQLRGCTVRLRSAVCIRQDAETPDQLVIIDLDTGYRRVLFDANPDTAPRTRGRARELQWTNSYGLPCYGHLVLPRRRTPARGAPLVIVGYQDLGFLRGGTGDEYPIYPLADAGFAVLSYNRPPMLGIARGGTTFAQVERINQADEAERKSIVSCIEGGIALARQAVTIDDAKIGLTGFSDGVTTAQYLLLHRTWVAAAALSHGSWEPDYAMALGPAAMSEVTALGYPDFDARAAPFWQHYSLRENLGHVTAPILFQVPDGEFSAALEGYTALKTAGKPADLFVFPDEWHIKWQPAHRLAVYRRALAWFRFWFSAAQHPAAARSDEARWLTLKRMPRVQATGADQ